MMDFAPIVPWLSAAAIVISLGTTVSGLLTGGARKTSERLDAYGKEIAAKFAKIEEVCDVHATRIQAIENEMKHLPDRGMVHELQLTLKDIQIEMASIKSETAQSTRISRRVEEYLMTKSAA